MILSHHIPGRELIKKLFITYPRFKTKASNIMSGAMIILFIFLSACSTMQQQKDPDLAKLEKQIMESGQKIDDIYHRVSVIQFMVDNHERSLKNIENGLVNARGIKSKKAEQQGSVDAAENSHTNSVLKITSAQDSPDIIYKKALASYKDKNYAKGISLFNSVVKNYPDHDLADNALYWVGECLYAQKKYSDAILAFKDVLGKYPEGSKVPDALLKTGYSYLAIDDKENAQLFLKKVVTNYPFSPAGNKAEATLKRINR